MYQIGDLTQKTRCFIKIAAEEHEMRLVKEKMKWRVVVKQMNLSQTLFGHELHKSLTEDKPKSKISEIKDGVSKKFITREQNWLNIVLQCSNALCFIICLFQFRWWKGWVLNEIFSEQCFLGLSSILVCFRFEDIFYFSHTNKPHNLEYNNLTIYNTQYFMMTWPAIKYWS